MNPVAVKTAAADPIARAVKTGKVLVEAGTNCGTEFKRSEGSGWLEVGGAVKGAQALSTPTWQGIGLASGEGIS